MRVRWVCGGRVFDGVTRETGAEYDLEDGTAASLIEAGFAEAIRVPAPAAPVSPRPFSGGSSRVWSPPVSEEQED